MKNERFESFSDIHLGIRTKTNKQELDYRKIKIKEIPSLPRQPLFKELKEVKKPSRVVVQLDKCSHEIFDYEKFSTKIYKIIETADGSEIVIRRYLNNRSGKSRYQIVKYFLCSKCYEYRICKGMSAIDLNHKEFKELIDGYINS